MDYFQFLVKDIIVSHDRFRISKVSFSLKSGDILGLVGRSGAGKSTLIKTFVGLKRPDFGIIQGFINGKTVDLNKVIGYSPQDNALYPFLTLEENLKTFGQLNKLPKSEIKSMSEFLLKRLDLWLSRKKKVVELSGGMQKRADLAVTLIHSPKIILLDEPFGGLDKSLQNFIWKLLRELSQQGCIIIISSHMLSDIQKNCNEFGLIEQGMFYNTNQINRTLKECREKSLETYLEKLFTRDLVKNE